MNNPYVGPRSFNCGEKLYGRGTESARLFHLLLADRIVLFYSPSGAGKTSLLQAQLTPRLQREGFDVIYDIRVGRKPGGTPSIPVNRYILGAMLSIEESLEKHLSLDELAAMSFGDYLKHVRELRPGRRRLALLFDQFEEIFVDPTDEAAKREFFRIVGELLEDSSLYAVFSMREDWIALMDEYADLIPSRFKARQRLSLLTEAQAVEAIREPASSEGVEFKVAEQLAHDLARTTIMSPDGSTREAYSFVEPVQLQVVCLTLWEKPRAKEKVIDNLAGVSVDTALADYYRRCIDEVVVKKKLADERTVREWFSGLITPRGLRAQVMLDTKKSGGLSNEAIDALVDKHLVRSEQRGGRTWFELSHDRLVNPIRSSNAEWNVEHLSLLQRRALEWEQQGRPAHLLLRGRALLDAKNSADVKQNAESLKTYESLFLETSKAAQTPLEARAVEWELAGRPEEKLLRGTALKEAERMAREAGEFQLAAEVRTFLAESRAGRKQRVFAIQFAIAVFIAAAAFAYSTIVGVKSKKLEQTLQAAQYIEPNHELDNDTLNQAVAADQKIEAIVEEAPPAAPQQPKITVQYFVKPGDSPRLREALVELGFNVEDERGRVNEPTNCVWYGSNVAEKDVKLVAYAILRAGGELQSVQKLDEKEGVVVGYNSRVASEQPLQIEEIDQLSLGNLERPVARKLDDAAEGTVTMLNADKRTGIINRNGESVTFRLASVAGDDVFVGDGVRFA
ncbi:MAG TPA: ATP-binding protein, partial [Thermoanaerobaculia bacterium]|nr:ATP-binding protein [Thermoanaerobaculia bacterium]